MTTQLNWAQLCQVVNTSTAAAVYGAVPAGSQVSITAASAWNPVGASSNAVVDLYIGANAADATHIDRVSVPPGAALPLSNAVNHKLTSGMSIYASTNGATLTVSGAIAS
jgi:hypothetical protein